MIPIASEKRVDWNAIRAVYIAGGTSYRQIAKKYNIPFGTVRRRAQVEKWVKEREIAEHNVNTITAQKTAEAAADNATIAQDLKKRLLLRLSRIEEKYPLDATEVRTRIGNSTAVYRIRDLTAAYKDLTDSMQLTQNSANELLQSLIALERGLL